MVMRVIDIPVEKVYVPSGKAKTLELAKVEPLAEDILENGLQNPIYVREGKSRYVLQEGLHRLEAVKLLGEATIEAKIIQAKKA
jgi:ParB-like chromosome segregation protein Spo0J